MTVVRQQRAASASAGLVSNERERPLPGVRLGLMVNDPPGSKVDFLRLGARPYSRGEWN